MLVFVHTRKYLFLAGRMRDIEILKCIHVDIPRLMLDLLDICPEGLDTPDTSTRVLYCVLLCINRHVSSLNFIFSKIIWDVLYWSQTHVRIYHSRLYFWRLIDNTFSDDWEQAQGYSTKIFFQYSELFFLSKIFTDCKCS